MKKGEALYTISFLIGVFLIIGIVYHEINSGKEKVQMSVVADSIFFGSIEQLKCSFSNNYFPNINGDSIAHIYNIIPIEQGDIKLKTSKKIKHYTDSVTAKNINTCDSLYSLAVIQNKKTEELAIKQAKIAAKNAEIAQRKFDNSPVGRMMKQHPGWSEDDCEGVLKHQVWIGMSIEMVIYENGRYFNRHDSNYGSGTEYQYCWEGGSISCFYCGRNGIVTSYN